MPVIVMHVRKISTQGSLQMTLLSSSENRADALGKFPKAIEVVKVDSLLYLTESQLTYRSLELSPWELV